MRTEWRWRRSTVLPFHRGNAKRLLDPEVLKERPQSGRIRMETVHSLAHAELRDRDVERLREVVLENEPLGLSVVRGRQLVIEGRPTFFQQAVERRALVVGEVQSA